LPDNYAQAAKNHGTQPRYATRRKVGTQKCKAPVGRQIATLFERATWFERIANTAAALAFLYQSVRSAWTKQSFGCDAPNLDPMSRTYSVASEKDCDLGTNICSDAPTGSTTIPEKQLQVIVISAKSTDRRRFWIQSDRFDTAINISSLVDTIASQSNTFG